MDASQVEEAEKLHTVTPWMQQKALLLRMAVIPCGPSGWRHLLLHFCIKRALRGRSSKEIQERAEGMPKMNVSTLEQMDWNQTVSAACLGRAFSDHKAVLAAGNLGHAWSCRLAGEQDKLWESEDMKFLTSIYWCPALHLGHSE